MTIDEAIAKYKEITNTDANCPAHCNISCDKCVQESEQLAEWLEELKEYKENQHRSLRHMYEKGYNKAIYDFVEELKDYFVIPHDVRVIEMKAERLKAGGK